MSEHSQPAFDESKAHSEIALDEDAPTYPEAVELMREACGGWPQPNPYDKAMDVIEETVDRLRHNLAGHGPTGGPFCV